MSKRRNAKSIGSIAASTGIVFLLFCFAGTALAALGDPAESRPVYPATEPRVDGSPSKGSAQFDDVREFSLRSIAPPPYPPGDTAGTTYWELQQNGSIGRQIVVSYNLAVPYVHVIWSKAQVPSGPLQARYNSRNFQDGTWVHGSGLEGGKTIGGLTSAFTSIDITSQGAAVVAFHEGPSVELISTYHAIDAAPPLGLFSSKAAPGPLNCQGEVSGDVEQTSLYVFPKVDEDEILGVPLTHIVSTEFPDPDVAVYPEEMSIIYYRYYDEILQPCPSLVDTLGTFIDYSYTVNAAVVSDPASDRVAIVYLKPLYPPDHPNNPCGDWLQWQHDVGYRESMDGGQSFIDGSAVFINITDYSNGGTLTTDQIPYMAYTDVSALYGSDGALHVVWNTPIFDTTGIEPCRPVYQSVLWHWDDLTGAISRVYDGARTRFTCPLPTWELSTAKVNISECNNNLYVSFTRFGAHEDDSGIDSDSSAAGWANGDIFITASSDGGATWGSDGSIDVYDTDVNAGSGNPVSSGLAVNLTNTLTTDCMSGDCHSENWSSMAEYSSDSLHIVYIDDNDGGSSAYGEGTPTNNAVMYTRYPCFAPVPYFEYSVTPLEFHLPLSPTSGSNCTVGTSGNITFTIKNDGNVPIDWVAEASDPLWMSPTSQSGTLSAGVVSSTDVTFDIGTFSDEGTASGSITVDLASSAGADQATISVDVTILCEYVAPAYSLISTTNWTLGVWNTGRIGTGGEDPSADMFWSSDGTRMLFDGGMALTAADNVSKTYFSAFEGSNSRVDFVPRTFLITGTLEDQNYAAAVFTTPDSAAAFFVEYITPFHPDSAVLIQRINIMNTVDSLTDTAIAVHLGDICDWDIESDSGSANNFSGYDPDRQMLYQYGTPGTPSEDHYAGTSVLRSIPGAKVHENDSTVYLNRGWLPEELGDFLATHNGFDPSAEVTDLNTVQVLNHDLVLQPDSHAAYTMVRAGSRTGFETLQELIDKGAEWITDRYMYIPARQNSGPVRFNIDGYVPSDGDPTGTQWIELYPDLGVIREVVAWVDDGDGIMSYSDVLKYENINDQADTIWETPIRLTTGMRVSAFFNANEVRLIDYNGENPLNDPITDANYTWWHENQPQYCLTPQLHYWADDGDGVLDPGDQVVLWYIDIDYAWLFDVTDIYTSVTGTAPECEPGNADGLESVDIDDAVYLITYIFNGGSPPRPRLCCGDANGSGDVDIDDVVYLINYIFGGGPAPVEICP
jgi:hypothetical protein